MACSAARAESQPPLGHQRPRNRRDAWSSASSTAAWASSRAAAPVGIDPRHHPAAARPAATAARALLQLLDRLGPQPLRHRIAEAPPPFPLPAARPSRSARAAASGSSSDCQLRMKPEGLEGGLDRHPDRRGRGRSRESAGDGARLRSARARPRRQLVLLLVEVVIVVVGRRPRVLLQLGLDGVALGRQVRRAAGPATSSSTSTEVQPRSSSSARAAWPAGGARPASRSSRSSSPVSAE